MQNSFKFPRHNTTAPRSGWSHELLYPHLATFEIDGVSEGDARCGQHTVSVCQATRARNSCTKYNVADSVLYTYLTYGHSFPAVRRVGLVFIAVRPFSDKCVQDFTMSIHIVKQSNVITFLKSSRENRAAFAHCISADRKMSKGIAKMVK